MYFIFPFIIVPSHPPPINEGAAPNRPLPPQDIDEMEEEAPLQTSNAIGVSNMSDQYMKYIV